MAAPRSPSSLAVARVVDTGRAARKLCETSLLSPAAALCGLASPVRLRCAQPRQGFFREAAPARARRTEGGCSQRGHPYGGWLVKCHGPQYVLCFMWMIYPNQADVCAPGRYARRCAHPDGGRTGVRARMVGAQMCEPGWWAHRYVRPDGGCADVCARMVGAPMCAPGWWVHRCVHLDGGCSDVCATVNLISEIIKLTVSWHRKCYVLRIKMFF